MHPIIMILIIAAIILLLIFLLCFYLAGFALSIHPQTYEEARAWQEEHYDISWYDQVEKESYRVRSEDGYFLYTEMLHNPAGGAKYVILSHGYTDNHFGSLKYAKLYLDRGFHVILYDLRGHGENEPDFCTYSVRESIDLAYEIRDCYTRHPEAEVLGIHGESLGAATSIAVLGQSPRVSFVVADCPFSDILPILKSGLSKKHLPGFLVHIASFCAKLRFGYAFSEMRPIEALKNNEVPILFIHGEKDTFIPPWHSKKMQEKTRGYSEFYQFDDAKHAESIFKDPVGYARDLDNFLAQVEKQKARDDQ